MEGGSVVGKQGKKAESRAALGRRGRRKIWTMGRERERERNWYCHPGKFLTRG